MGVVGLFLSKTKDIAEVAGDESTSVEDVSEAASFSGADYLFVGAMIAGSVIRIWEIVDVWMLPSNYKVVKESPFQIKPLAFFDSGKRFNYGLSLSYQF